MATSLVLIMTTAEARDVRIAKNARDAMAKQRTRVADAIAESGPKAEPETKLAQTPPDDRINHLAQEWEQNRPKTD